MKSAGPQRSREQDDVQLLAALADPTRLTIVRQLAAQGEVCACDFTSCCGVSQPTVSHHLKVLREAGVVKSERRGTWVYYRLEPAAQRRLEALVASVVPAGLGGAAVPKRLPVVQPSA